MKQVLWISRHGMAADQLILERVMDGHVRMIP